MARKWFCDVDGTQVYVISEGTQVAPLSELDYGPGGYHLNFEHELSGLVFRTQVLKKRDETPEQMCRSCVVRMLRQALDELEAGT